MLLFNQFYQSFLYFIHCSSLFRILSFLSNGLVNQVSRINILLNILVEIQLFHLLLELLIRVSIRNLRVNQENIVDSFPIIHMLNLLKYQFLDTSSSQLRSNRSVFLEDVDDDLSRDKQSLQFGAGHYLVILLFFNDKPVSEIASFDILHEGYMLAKRVLYVGLTRHDQVNASRVLVQVHYHLTNLEGLCFDVRQHLEDSALGHVLEETVEFVIKIIHWSFRDFSLHAGVKSLEEQGVKNLVSLPVPTK